MKRGFIIAGLAVFGKRADFLILSANPPDDIANTTRLVAIYHGGARIEPAFIEAAPAVAGK